MVFFDLLIQIEIKIICEKRDFSKRLILSALVKLRKNVCIIFFRKSIKKLKLFEEFAKNAYLCTKNRDNKEGIFRKSRIRR